MRRCGQPPPGAGGKLGGSGVFIALGGAAWAVAGIPVRPCLPRSCGTSPAMAVSLRANRLSALLTPIAQSSFKTVNSSSTSTMCELTRKCALSGKPTPRGAHTVPRASWPLSARENQPGLMVPVPGITSQTLRLHIPNQQGDRKGSF